MPVFALGQTIQFPPPHLSAEGGLLAVGGDLSIKRLIAAYRMGIFPWYSQDQPILWWSPDPRLVLYPNELHIAKRLKRTIRQNRFQTSVNRDFDAVIRACAKTPRRQGDGTWILDEMIEAYIRLNHAGYAHSVETWHGETLVGGLYGVSLGRCFFGESMFSREDDASKVAFVNLVRHLRRNGFRLIDCQVKTTHLKRFGAREISRRTFLSEIQKAIHLREPEGVWDEGLIEEE